MSGLIQVLKYYFSPHNVHIRWTWLLVPCTDEEIAAERQDRGEQFDPKWMKLSADDKVELSIKDMLMNIKNNKSTSI